MKKYANKKRKVKPHGFVIGDKVLLKRQKQLSNKMDSLFDPEPYNITEIKGPMITVKRGKKLITRNASFFRPLFQK